jgi:hypothetical protein
MRRSVLFLAAAAVVLPATASAADKKPALAASAAAMLKCRDLADAATRLSCFDAAAAAFDAEVGRGDLVVIDRETMRKTRNSLFGFDINLPDFGGKGESAPKEIIERATRVKPFGHAMWQITLESGAVWQTSEGMPTLAPPRVGENIKIRKTMTGGYMLHLGSRLIRIRRVA